MEGVHMDSAHVPFNPTGGCELATLPCFNTGASSCPLPGDIFAIHLWRRNCERLLEDWNGSLGLLFPRHAVSAERIRRYALSKRVAFAEEVVPDGVVSEVIRDSITCEDEEVGRSEGKIEVLVRCIRRFRFYRNTPLINHSLDSLEISATQVMILPEDMSNAAPAVGSASFVSPWIWRRACPRHLARELLKEMLRRGNEEDYILKLFKSSPPLLSYTLTKAFAMDNSHRMRIASFQSNSDRLRYILDFHEKSRQLLGVRCQCGAILQDGEAVEPVSLGSDSSGTFCNPGGIVHGILTMKTLRNDTIELVGFPSAENSWFDGFAWTIACCSYCGEHLGWRFTPDDGQELHNDQQTFWGLRITAVERVSDMDIHVD